MTFFAAEAFFRQGTQRWAFGLDNPNKAATVLALLLLLLLAATVRARRGWIRWSCCGLAVIAGTGLSLTLSRGGLAAFVVGAATLLAGLRKSLLCRRRWLPAFVAACALVGAMAWTGLAGRVAHSSPAADASAGNRLAIWRNVPSMMVDAPGGWGRGAAGDAFMGWYQPLDRHERYRTLVNSHFTWLVECGWIGRFALAWAWMLAFGMGLVRWKTRGDPLPLAVWVGFATAAFFSSVAEEWIVDIVPVAMLLPAAWTFCSTSATTRRLTMVSTALASGLALSVFAALGVACRPADTLQIHRSHDGTRLTVGAGEPDGWIVCDEKTVGGATYGRALREFARTPEGRGRAYGLARDLAAVPKDVRLLALCGSAANGGSSVLAPFAALADVRVLSPNTPADWLAARGDKPSVRVFCGEFAASCPEKDFDGLTVVPGAADYLPDWPRLAFSRSLQP